MKTRRYNKKIIGMLMLPLVVGSVNATPVFSADLTPAAGETVTLSGQSNVDRIMATDDGVNVILTEDAKLTVNNAYPSVSLYGNSSVTLNAGSSISNNTSADNWVYAPAVSIINNNFTANTTNTVTLNNATINADSTGNYVHPSGIYLQDYSNDGTSIVTLDNNSHVNATSTVTNSYWTYAHALGVYVGGTKNAIVTLSNNSSVSVTAVSDTTGLTNASAEISWSTKGIYADSQSDGVASITLSDNSSVNVTGSASSDSWSSTGFINGVYANSQGGGDAIITLDSGSSVNIGTNATVNGTYAFAASNHIYGLNAWTDYGDTIITLDNNSSVSAVATVTMENAVDPNDIKAQAYGMKTFSKYGNADINISDSSISTTSSATEEVDGTASATTDSLTYATGIKTYIKAGNSNITLNNSTLSTTATSSFSSTATDLSGSDAKAYAYGIRSNNISIGGDTTITLNNSTVTTAATSSNNTTATTSTYSADSNAFAYGVYTSSTGTGTTTVTLNNSAVDTIATSTTVGANDSGDNDSLTDAYGVKNVAADGATLTNLANSSITVTASATSPDESTSLFEVGKKHHFAQGVYSYSETNASTITLNNSSVDVNATTISTATGTDAFTRGSSNAFGLSVSTKGAQDASVSLSNNSSVLVTATDTALITADNEGATAGTDAFGVYARNWGLDSQAMADAIISLESGSSVSASATALAAKDAKAQAYGLYASGKNNAVVTLSNGSTSASASASSSKDDLYSIAKSFGIMAETTTRYDVTVSLDGSSSTAASSATKTGANATADAIANGVYASAAQNATISLSNNSVTAATADATTTNTGSAATAEASGIKVYAEQEIAVNLSSSSATASASASGESSTAFAAGIFASGNGTNSAVINLTNNSHASASADGTGTLQGAGIYVTDIANATVNIDSTSSVSGNNFAIASNTSNLTIYNSGLIAGRIQTETLVNSSSGTMNTAFSAQSAQMIGGVNDDGSYYNNAADSATLADGSTVSVTLGDDNLGLVNPGDSESYRVLAVATPNGGSWNTSAVKIEATNADSPMLNLAWSNLSDPDHLILKATFLSAEDACLSDNGTAAFGAAYADGLFNFASSPEEWTPDISGGGTIGKTMLIRNTYRSVDSRLASLESGVNAGDETVTQGVWSDIRYTSASQDEKGIAEGFDAETKGLTIGYDRQINSQMTLGTALSYAVTSAETNVYREQFDMDDYLLSVYGNYLWNDWFFEAQISYGWGNTAAQRAVGASVLKADYDSNVYYARLATGHNYLKSGWVVSPMAALDYTTVSFDKYRESGGAMALSVQTEDFKTCNIGTGLKLERMWKTNGDISITPQLSAMLNYDLIADKVRTTSTFVGGSTAFITEGVDPDRASINLAANFNFKSLASPISFDLGYEYIGQENFNSHTIKGKFRYEFY